MHKPLRILHLEDDPDFSALVATMLEREGVSAELVVAGNHAEFATALQQDGFDLILADYLLPTGNGIQALEMARQKRPDLPFLLISGTIGEQAAIESLRSGATDYVLKNRIERLVPAIRRAVQESDERAQRRRVETELVRREKYFRALTEYSLDVLTILSADGRFLYNSPSLLRVLGYEPKDLAGRNAFNLVHPDDVQGALQAFQRAIENPEHRITHEFRYLRKDGSWCCLESVGQNRLEDPEIAGVVLNSRDVGDRKRVEEELRRSEAQYRVIFDSNPTPMWVIDLETLQLLEANEAAVLHYGYSREEFLQMTLKDIRPPEDVPEFVASYQKLAGSVKLSSTGCGGLWRHRKKDGTLMEVEVNWSVIAFKGRLAFLSTANNVTERKRIERREAALSKLSRQLSSATSAVAAAHIINDVADDLFRWDFFALGLYSGASDTIRPVLRVEASEGRRDEIPTACLPGKPDAIIRRVLTQGPQLMSAADLNAECRWFKTGAAASLMLMPVRNGAKIIGVLSLQSHVPDAFKEADLNTLQTLADHCGGALERIHAEQALRESERRFRELFEGSPDAILVADLNGRVMDLNPAACRLHGMTRERLAAEKLTSLVTPERADEIVAHLGELIAGAVSQVESVFLAGDGRAVPVEVRGNCIEYGGKQAVLLHVRDITERRQAAEALKKSEASLAAAQRIAHLGSWELELTPHADVNRNELRWSDETYRIFGGEPRAVAVTNELFHNAVHPQDRERIAEAMARALRTGEPYDLEHRILLPNGEERTVRERGELALDTNGKPVQMRGIVMDITERKRLEEQLRQSQKMEAIGQLAGGVAHDFNNILTVIHGHASLLTSTSKLSETAAKSAHQIGQAAERAAGLTRQLLTFSRRQVMQPRRLDINEVVSQMTMMLGRILGENIALQLKYWPHPALVQADASMMEQVLLNLAINARDAMPKGGQLLIRISGVAINSSHLAYHPEARTGQFVCLTVTDTGLGIPPENLRRIFEPFFTTKEVGKGTGLGLATVYGIVKQHQGWIEVESHLRQGATFRVFLPASGEVGAGVPDEPIRKTVRGGTETVLLVEDEAPVRELVCAILSANGYTILEAESGVKALEVWRGAKDRIDLLLTDLIMPDRMNGRELAEQLVSEQPRLKVMFSSGYSADVVGNDFVLQRGLHYLQKPYDPHKLLVAVRDCLDA
jgi:two-component system, cell cycle sensor histidine kinase and response regulator CckA